MDNLLLTRLEFEKYHGLGNDYIIINDIKIKIPESKKSKLALELCRFHFSIGADGLIYVCNSSKADIKMRIFNKDGTEAEMCGNGIRCFSKYIYEKQIVKKKEIRIETLKGIMVSKLNVSNNKVESVQIDMGPPILNCEEIPVMLDSLSNKCINEPITIIDRIFNFTAVSMGNPNAVIFIEDQLNDEQLNMYGASIETHQRFPNRTNVEFVKIISDVESFVRVFERGVGITKSCGTGSCAAVVAGTILGIFKKNTPITVHNDGGDLKITYTGKTVLMEGPVVKVFSGVLNKIEV
ncbi:MAG: diaminopimelate epimerase [Promethearchaeota archaeon]